MASRTRRTPGCGGIISFCSITEKLAFRNSGILQWLPINVLPNNVCLFSRSVMCCVMSRHSIFAYQRRLFDIPKSPKNPKMINIPGQMAFSSSLSMHSSFCIVKRLERKHLLISVSQSRISALSEKGENSEYH